MEKDIRREIVTGAMINGVVINSIDQTESVRAAVRKVVSPAGAAEKFSLLNMAHIAGLMYCILLVPRELALEKAGTTSYEEFLHELEQYHFDAFFEVTILDEAFQKYPSRRIIPCLRNAVAHVNFRYSIDDERFIFWNSDTKDRAKILWKANCGREQLLQILNQVGNLLIGKFLQEQASD